MCSHKEPAHCGPSSAGLQSQKKKKRKGLIAKCTSIFNSCIWESSKGKDGKAEAPGSEAEISEVMKASVEKWENYFHRSRLWN